MESSRTDIEITRLTSNADFVALTLNEGTLIVPPHAKSSSTYRAFWRLSWRTDGATAAIIAVRSEDHGLDPTVALVEPLKLLLVAVDRTIVAINADGRQVYGIRTNSIVHHIEIVGDAELLAICETGLLAFNANGHVLWDREVDVISDFQVVNGVAWITELDGAMAGFDLKTGRKA